MGAEKIAQQSKVAKWISDLDKPCRYPFRVCLYIIAAATPMMTTESKEKIMMMSLHIQTKITR
jgi:hypothetical protein